MKQEYSDITKKLGKPVWWDEAGCPRYEPFQPCMANDFYAEEVALLRIACQNCQTEYLVSVSSGIKDSRAFRERPLPLAYGDPPRSCCGAGATMTSETLEIVELWVFENSRWQAKLPNEYLDRPRPAA